MFLFRKHATPASEYKLEFCCNLHSRPQIARALERRINSCAYKSMYGALVIVETLDTVLQAAKREKHAETGSECEHGVWRCRICDPPQRTKR